MDLSAVLLGNRRGPLPLRWVDMHVLRELAQHYGHAAHADILHEQLVQAHRRLTASAAKRSPASPFVHLYQVATDRRVNKAATPMGSRTSGRRVSSHSAHRTQKVDAGLASRRSVPMSLPHASQVP